VRFELTKLWVAATRVGPLRQLDIENWWSHGVTIPTIDIASVKSAPCGGPICLYLHAAHVRSPRHISPRIGVDAAILVYPTRLELAYAFAHQLERMATLSILYTGMWKL
jgi:hypothetical protein